MKELISLQEILTDSCRILVLAKSLLQRNPKNALQQGQWGGRGVIRVLWLIGYSQNMQLIPKEDKYQLSLYISIIS